MLLAFSKGRSEPWRNGGSGRGRRLLAGAVSAAVALLVVGSSARAGTDTWTGNTNANWSNNGNWSNGQPPQTSDDVVITGGNPVSLNVGTTVTVKTFTIDAGYSSTVTQNGSTPLHVTSTFSISAGTFAASGSSTVQIDGAATVSGGTFTSNGTTLTVGSLAVSSGTFNGGSAAIVDTGGLSLTGGTFTATTGTMQIGGAFNHAAANIFNDNGTMLFNATSAQSHTFGGATMPTIIINDGLAAYWTLDDGSGKPADSSGYGNTLTRSGTTTFNSTGLPAAITFANADMLTFDGSTGFATISAPAAMPAANAAQTISLWAKFASSSSTQAMLALTGGSSAVVLGLGSGNIRAWKNSGTDLAHTAAPTDGGWHHLAYSFDGGNADKIYLDGVLMTSGLNPGHDSGAVTSVFMGAASASASFFNGSLDDVRVYNRALSAREIGDLAFGHMPGTGVATHTFSDAFATDNGLDLVLASGVVAGSASMTIGGSWLNYGGKFTGTGSITLTSSHAETLLSGGQFFANLTVSASGKYTTADRLWMSGQTLNLTVAQALSPAYPLHVGSIADTTGTNNGLAIGSNQGFVVLDGTSNQSLNQKNLFGLRIEDPSETGIVGYWKLDEGQSTTARDVSGNGNTAALSAGGSSWTSPPGTITFDDAAAVKLNGASGYVSLGTTNLPAANGTETISVWVKLGSTSGTQDFIALGDGSGHGVKLGLNGGTLAAFTWAGTSLVSGTTPVDGAWHNVVYSYDGTNNRLYVDGAAVTPTTTAHQSAATTAAFLGTYDGTHELFNGSIDDVRVYNTALTAAQVGQISKGRYAGTGGVATVTQTNAAITIPIGDYGFMIDSGIYYTNDQNLTVNVITTPCIVYAGTLHVGSKVANCDGGLTVNPLGTLLLDTSGGQFKPGQSSTVAIDGTLTATTSGALLSRDASGDVYSLQIGTFAGSTPTLNITGLTIRFTDANGVQIDNLLGTPTGATTTYTHFDNIIFRQAAAGTSQYLSMYAKALNLSSSGCTFGNNGDTNFPTLAVKLTGNGTGDGETRAVFGSTTCQSKSGAWTGGGSDKICVAAAKSDDDSDGNGIADSATAGTNGAVVQFVRAAEDDTAGTVIGFPTAAFDWNTFTYYSTYVAFHNAASGSSDVIYVRDELGNPLYSWTVPTAGETITGTPQWNTSGTTHFVYVATSAGKIYRLIDTATGTTSGTLSLDTTNAPWSTTNPFNCGCTISTPLGIDATNLYWGSTTSNQNFWTLGQSTQSNPTPITISQTVTNTGLSMATIGSTAYAFMGVQGAVLDISTAGNSISATNTGSPGTIGSILGRIQVGFQGGAVRVYAGDDAGTMWALNGAPASFGGAKLWSYAAGSAIKSSPYYDYTTDTVQYGTQGGAIIVQSGATGVTLNSALNAYPYTPAAGDPITAAPLYYSGVLAVGSTGGKLYFIDRNTGNSSKPVSIIREYQFGSSESVSGVGFDSTVNRYMVTTASSSGDGRLYYIDLVADPTPGSS
jgi:hypothetical protein